MPDWLFERSTVIGLAVAGGLFSLLASWCQAKGKATEEHIKWLNKVAYTFMAISMVLFVFAGLLGVDAE